MDDLLIPVELADDYELEAPRCLLTEVAELIAEVRASAEDYGFSLNLAKGKTEVLIDAAGRGSKTLRRWMADLLADDDGCPVLPIPGGGTVRLVTDYKHLGVRASAAASQAKEVAARATATDQASAALWRELTCKHYAVSTRAVLAGACAHSKLLLGAGTWNPFTPQQEAKLHSAMLKPLRLAAGAHQLPLPGERRRRDVDVLASMQVPSLRARLDMARLRYLLRVAQYATDFHRALLRGPAAADWRKTMVDSAVRLQEALHPKLQALPHPEDDMAAWEAFALAWPGQWCRLVDT